MKKLIAILALSIPFSNAVAANSGLITRIDFTSIAYAPHPDVVQMQIEGGFSQGSCDTTFAAIRKIDTHLVGAALAAKAAGATVQITLDPNQMYFGNRCVITLISIL